MIGARFFLDRSEGRADAARRAGHDGGVGRQAGLTASLGAPPLTPASSSEIRLGLAVGEIAGNQSLPADDYLTMMCEHVRVALSARLDGEDPPTPAAEIDAHTATCADCRAWLARAQRLDLVVRATPASPAADLTVRVLAAVGAEQRQRDGEPAGRRQVLRIAVGVLAVAQLISAVPVLLGPEGALGAHATREMACFDIALAVGFALAALRPERARALVPVAFVLALCLAVTSAVDVLNAQTAVIHEIGHLAAVAQAAALWALGRGQRRNVPLAPATAAGRG